MIIYRCDRCNREVKRGKEIKIEIGKSIAEQWDLCDECSDELCLFLSKFKNRE